MDRQMDGWWTDMISPMCVHFMHNVKRTYKNVTFCTILAMINPTGKEIGYRTRIQVYTVDSQLSALQINHGDFFFSSRAF
jgi:hypothetical protein